MINHNMRHMQHLLPIVVSDVSVLAHKESTYQGSWKLAGGRSAWFMLRRNMDRLLSMMSSAPRPTRDQLSGGASADLAWSLASADDIFLAVESRPDGSDGTVLAVIRDLRRYLLLVESEMVSRGVVGLETPPPEVNIYDLLSRMTDTPRDVVKRVLHALSYGADGTQSVGDAPAPVPAEDSNRHADRDMAPYEVTQEPVGENADFYYRRALSLWRLRDDTSGLSSGHLENIPRYVRARYVLVSVPRGIEMPSDEVLVLDRRLLTDQERVGLPRFPTEQNNSEWMGLPYATRGLYAWRGVPRKWMMEEKFVEHWSGNG